MTDSTYEKIKGRLDYFWDIATQITQKGFSSENVTFSYISQDKLQISLDIDQFVKENPDTHIRYLKEFLRQYSLLQFVLFKNDAFNYNICDEQYSNNILLSETLNYIVSHLEWLLEEENSIHDQKESVNKAEKQIKGKSKLSREQTALLFFYLRERQLISQPTNENLAIAVSMLTGHSKKQIQDIIKSPETPAFQLGKDNNNKVSRDDFKSLISELKDLVRTVEKDYKEYSDKSELR